MFGLKAISKANVKLRDEIFLIKILAEKMNLLSSHSLKIKWYLGISQFLRLFMFKNISACEFRRISRFVGLVVQLVIPKAFGMPCHPDRRLGRVRDKKVLTVNFKNISACEFR